MPEEYNWESLESSERKDPHIGKHSQLKLSAPPQSQGIGMWLLPYEILMLSLLLCLNVGHLGSLNMLLIKLV